MKEKRIQKHIKNIAVLNNGIVTSNYKILMYLASFILPVMVFALAYYNAGIFTNSALLVNDLNTQYVNFLSYYRNNIIENGVFYSFSKDLGGNFYGVFTYYLMSPLNIIAFLFRPQHMEYAVATLMLLRTGLSGLAAFVFLEKQDLKNDIITLTLSICYSLSSCFVVWHYHILWQDAYYLLPIILLGTQYILSKKSGKLFIASFTLCLIINYYMAYMIAIFIIAYFVYDIIKSNDKTQVITKFIRMAKAAAISALLSAWVTVPTIYSLLQGKVSYNESIALEVRTIVYNIIALAPKLLNAGYDGVGNVSTPYLYSSAVITALVLAFFCLKNISRREKVATAFVIVFLIASTTVRPLFLAFHMFSVPNAFPYRFVFVLPCFSVFIAYKTVRNFKQINFKAFVLLLAGFVAILLLMVFIYPYEIPFLNTCVTLLILALTCAVLYKSKGKKILLNAIFILVMLDLGLNTARLLQGNYDYLTYEELGEFEKTYAYTSGQISSVQTDEFYRIANVDEPEFINNSFKYGFNNYYVSFTSLPEENAYYLMENYIMPCENAQLATALFGVRYKLEYGRLSKEQQAFPLVFTSDKSIFEEDNRSIEDFVQNIYGEEFAFETSVGINENLNEIIDTANRNINDLTQEKNKITLTINTDNTDTYALSTIIYDEGWSVKVNGKRVQTQKVLDSLLAFPLEEGENSVVLTYTPKGFAVGAGTSLICALVLLGMALLGLCPKNPNFF